MEQDTPLDEMYRSFSAGSLSRPGFEGALYEYARSNPRRFRFPADNPEEVDDFMGWAFPRMRGAIDSYRETGSCFDAYFGSLMRWAVADYRTREAERRAAEQAYWSEQALETADRIADYSAAAARKAEAAGGSPDREAFGQPLKNPRQVLALTLKCCLYVSDDLARRIAPALGMEARALQERIDLLRRGMAARVERRAKQEERIAMLYYRSVVIEAKLGKAPEGSAEQRRLDKALRTARSSLALARRRCAAISTEATNKEVAEVLGIPKGTVDASLHFLKLKAKPLPPPGPGKL